MSVIDPIIPLEFDASFSYIQRIFCIAQKLNEQGLTVNQIISKIESLEGSISQEIKDEIFKQFQNSGNLKNALTHRKILIVGDSYTYGTGLADRSNRFANLMKNKGFDITDISSPGGGFISAGSYGTFYDLINNFIDYDYNSFTDVWFLGGINDTYVDYSLIRTTIENTFNFTRNKFPNATICVGYISQTQRLSDGGCNYKKAMEIRQAYRELCLGGKACYINNSDYMLKQLGVLQADGLHPNEIGHNLIANYLISYILNGNISVTRFFDGVTLTPSESTEHTDFFVEQRIENNMFTINQINPSVYRFNNIHLTLDGNNSIVVGDMKFGLIFGQANSIGEFGCVNFTIPATVTYGNTSNGANVVEVMPISIRIVGYTVFFAPLKITSNASAFFDCYIRQINLPPWSFTCATDMV